MHKPAKPSASTSVDGASTRANPLFSRAPQSPARSLSTQPSTPSPSRGTTTPTALSGGELAMVAMGGRMHGMGGDGSGGDHRSRRSTFRPSGGRGRRARASRRHKGGDALLRRQLGLNGSAAGAGTTIMESPLETQEATHQAPRSAAATATAPPAVAAPSMKSRAARLAKLGHTARGGSGGNGGSGGGGAATTATTKRARPALTSVSSWRPERKHEDRRAAAQRHTGGLPAVVAVGTPPAVVSTSPGGDRKSRGQRGQSKWR